jgi:hypothetical protein
MSTSVSLLETVQRLLERTYAMRSGVGEVGRFLVGDAGYRRFYGSVSGVVRRVDTTECESRLLVRDSADGVRACIYYPDSVVHQLEARPPQHGLCDRNVDAFAVLVEELDHLLVIAERSFQGRPVSLFELELHANVSKQLVLERFLAGRSRRLGPRRRVWLRHHLFGKLDYCDEDLQVRSRYREAARWAVKFLDALYELRPAQRLGELRRFHRASSCGKVQFIAGLEA